jgi:Family of unknown function (DUF5681)
MKPKQQPRGDYEVGYARPPVSTRFQPGKSGNPRGRSPAPSSETRVREAFKRLLFEFVGEHNGRKVTAIEAALLKARNNAITKGDMRSIKAILELCEHYNAVNPASENSSGERRTGVLVVPTMSVSGEEWEREHGFAARGKPPPPDGTAPPAQAPPPATVKRLPVLGIDC